LSLKERLPHLRVNFLLSFHSWRFVNFPTGPDSHLNHTPQGLTPWSWYPFLFLPNTPPLSLHWASYSTSVFCVPPFFVPTHAIPRNPSHRLFLEGLAPIFSPLTASPFSPFYSDPLLPGTATWTRHGLSKTTKQFSSILRPPIQSIFLPEQLTPRRIDCFCFLFLCSAPAKREVRFLL